MCFSTPFLICIIYLFCWLPITRGSWLYKQRTCIVNIVFYLLYLVRKKFSETKFYKIEMQFTKYKLILKIDFIQTILWQCKLLKLNIISFSKGLVRPKTVQICSWKVMDEFRFLLISRPENLLPQFFSDRWMCLDTSRSYNLKILNGSISSLYAINRTRMMY